MFGERTEKRARRFVTRNNKESRRKKRLGSRDSSEECILRLSNPSHSELKAQISRDEKNLTK